MQTSFDALKESAKVWAALCTVGLNTESDELAASKISCSWNADEEKFLLLHKEMKINASGHQTVLSKR
jgi:hypothetical protein